MQLTRVLLGGVGLVGLFASFLWGMGIPPSPAPSGEGRAGCDLVLTPRDALPEAFGKAPPGAEVCLAPGVYPAGVTLTRDITLRGLGRAPEDVVFQGAEAGKPVVFVRSLRGSAPPRVALIRLTLERAYSVPLNAEGEPPRAGPCFDWLRCPFGLQVEPLRSPIPPLRPEGGEGGYRPSEDPLGPPSPPSPSPPPPSPEGPSACVVLQEVLIRDNVWGGILAEGQASVLLEDTRVDSSVLAYGESRLRIRGGWLERLRAGARSRIEAEGSELDFVFLQDSAAFEARSSRFVGLRTEGRARASLADSEVVEGTNGVVLGGKSELVLEGTRIAGHRACGLDVQSPDARVILVGRGNEVTENFLDLCGGAPASLYRPRVPQTDATEVRVPDDYATLQEAIDAVAPGGTVTLPGAPVRAGGVVVWKPVTIQGRGAGRTVTVLAARLSVLAEASPFRLEALRITPDPLGLDRREGPAPPTLSLYADAELREVTVSGNPEGGGIVVGGAARVRVQDATVSGNDGRGIAVYGAASLEVEDTRVFANRTYGLTVSDQTHAVVRRSTFFDGNGLAAEGEARLEAYEVTVLDAYQGVALFGPSTVVLRDVTLRRNREGIWVGGGGKRPARLVLERVEIVDSKEQGLYVSRSSRIALRDSRLQANGWGGIFILNEDVSLEIVNTRIVDHPDCGIEILKPIPISGEGNPIYGNRPDLCGYAPPAIRVPRVPETSREVVRVPEDYTSIQDAIDAVAPGGTVSLPAGEFEEALTLWKPLTLKGVGKETAFRRSEGLAPLISVPHGVEGVRLEDLSIAEADDVGILVYGTVEIVRVSVSNAGGCCDEGILARGTARLLLEEVTIRQSPDGLVLEGAARAEVYNSRFLDNREGILVKDEAQLVLRDSRVELNDTGLLVGGRSSLFLQPPRGRGPTVRLLRTRVSANEEVGMVLSGPSEVELQSSLIADNGEKGIVVEEGASVHLEGNEIRGHVGGCALEVVSSQTRITGRDNALDENVLPLCGFAPASLRRPSVPETERTEIRFPGEYATLQEAADALAPGGTLLLEGEVTGRVIVTKPLTIRGSRSGSGGEGEATWEPEDPGGLMLLLPVGVEGEVLLEDLTLTGDPGSLAVLAWGGELTIRRVDLVRVGGGLIAQGAGAILLEDVAVEGGEVGLTFGGTFDVVLRNVRVSAQREWALAAVESPRIRVEDSVFRDNMGVTILVGEEVEAQLVRSEVRDNAGRLPAVVAARGARLRVLQSRIARNEEGGLWAHEGAQLTVEDSEIVANGEDRYDGIGVYVSEGA